MGKLTRSKVVSWKIRKTLGILIIGTFLLIFNTSFRKNQDFRNQIDLVRLLSLIKLDCRQSINQTQSMDKVRFNFIESVRLTSLDYVCLEVPIIIKLCLFENVKVC